MIQYNIIIIKKKYMNLNFKLDFGLFQLLLMIIIIIIIIMETEEDVDDQQLFLIIFQPL